MCGLSFWIDGSSGKLKDDYNLLANIKAELDAGADVMVRNTDGLTPLHWAAKRGTSANIPTLLDAGADAKVKNEELKGAKGYGALNDAQHN
jgi:ankyrin repeat protein